jgi:hypothetical protein
MAGIQSRIGPRYPEDMVTTDPTTLAPRRFSLRLPRLLWIGLLTAALVVVAVGLGIGMPVYRQHVAWVELERLGAGIGHQQSVTSNFLRRVGYSYAEEFNDIVEVDFSHAEPDDDALRVVTGLSHL